MTQEFQNIELARTDYRQTAAIGKKNYDALPF
jgi:hypothetical protein